MNEVGLINYLPAKIKHTITRRSIFDILMDIWYLPTISEYIKLLVKPIVYKISPEDATKVLEDFDPQVRKFFLTKGIINLFPTKVKNAFLPEERAEVPSHSNHILITEENLSDSTREEIHPINSFDNNCQESNTNQLEINIPRALQEQRVALYKPAVESVNKRRRKQSANSIVSPLNEIRISNSLVDEMGLVEQLEMDAVSEDDGGQLMTRNVILPREDENYRFYEIDDELGKVVYKTIVLESTEKMKRLHQVESSKQDLSIFSWDNIEEYKIREAKKALKLESTPKANFLQMFTKSIQQQILSKVDYNKLSKAFVICILTFAIQMIVSKRARRWSLSLIQFLIYSITSLGAGGTLYFLMKKRSLSK